MPGVAGGSQIQRAGWDCSPSFVSRLSFDMPTTPVPSAAAPATWLHHLEDEADAAFLYRALADVERDATRAGLYQQLAEVEDRHVQMWRKLLLEHGHEPPT